MYFKWCTAFNGTMSNSQENVIIYISTSTYTDVSAEVKVTWLSVPAVDLKQVSVPRLPIVTVE